MDYMDLTVRCLRQAVKPDHSLVQTNNEKHKRTPHNCSFVKELLVNVKLSNK